MEYLILKSVSSQHWFSEETLYTWETLSLLTRPADPIWVSAVEIPWWYPASGKDTDKLPIFFLPKPQWPGLLVKLIS